MKTPTSMEDLIEAAVARALTRSLLAEQIRGLRDEIAAIRRALPPQFGSVAEAARVLGCCDRTVWRQIRAGKLPSRRVGRKTVVDLAALHAVTDDDTDDAPRS
jgi:excisionase family DNA binding protein